MDGHDLVSTVRILLGGGGEGDLQEQGQPPDFVILLGSLLDLNCGICAGKKQQTTFNKCSELSALDIVMLGNYCFIEIYMFCIAIGFQGVRIFLLK